VLREYIVPLTFSHQLPIFDISFGSSDIKKHAPHSHTLPNGTAHNVTSKSMTIATALAYSVVSCTSNDPKYPITLIQSASIRSPGWQSAPSPRYPIEFVLDLGATADLETIEFVSHQYKIASRVELYVAGPGQRYQALGSFRFSDNSRTNYSARELKSATIQGVRANFIRVSIPGCHPNGNNLQNQVGLISVIVIGRGGMVRSQMKAPIPSAVLPLDSQDLVEILEGQKKEAIAREDFSRAEALKQQIDRLRRSYDRVMELQRQKSEAIKKEDYVTAQRLKNQIDQLLNPQQASEEPPPSNRPNPEPHPPPTEESKNPPPSPPPPPPRPRKKPPSPPANRQRAEADDRPLHPAASPSGPSPRRVIRPPPEVGDNPSGLSEQNSQNAGILVSFIGEAPLALFYSRAPAAQQAHRKRGIEEIARIIVGLKNPSDQIACFARFCHILKPRVQERAIGVFDAALKAVAMIGNPMAPADISRCVAELVPVVATKLAILSDHDDDDRDVALSLPKSTREFFLWLAAKEQWELIVPLLTAPLKHQNLWKIAVNQIRLLTEITAKLHKAKKKITSVPGLSLPVIMGFLLPHIESSKREVRDPAIDLLVGLKLCGATVDGYIEKLGRNARADVEAKLSTEQHPCG
jgi:centrosomal protein CEP104